MGAGSGEVGRPGVPLGGAGYGPNGVPLYDHGVYEGHRVPDRLYDWYDDGDYKSEFKHRGELVVKRLVKSGGRKAAEGYSAKARRFISAFGGPKGVPKLGGAHREGAHREGAQRVGPERGAEGEGGYIWYGKAGDDESYAGGGGTGQTFFKQAPPS
jgi:hypothetical protein